MNRKDYLYNLKIHLQEMPDDELQDVLLDYEEHFNIGLSKGKTEDEISKELGHPKDIADNYKANYSSNNEHYKREQVHDPARKLLIVLLLGFFNLVVVLGPSLAIFGMMLGGYGIAIGLFFGGLALLTGIPFSFFVFFPQPHILTSISFGIGFMALGTLCIILFVYLTKLAYQFTVRYIKWNIELINR